MKNVIFIEGAKYDDAKQAFIQWLEQYEDNPKKLKFELYQLEQSHFAIVTDEKLENEHFNYLLNYLKYPIDIKYTVKVKGYITVSDAKMSPPGFMNERVMVFMPDNDKEYDKVHWANQHGEVYKIKFSGKKKKLESISSFTEPLLDLSTLTPEEFYSTDIMERDYSSFSGEDVVDEDEHGILKRFKVVVGIILFAVVLSLVFMDDISQFNAISRFIGVGTSIWFLMDYKMLQINKFYNYSLLFSVALFSVGLLIREFDYTYKIFGSIISSYSSPLFLLVIQKPIRLFFKQIMKREPVLKKPSPFPDIFYFMILIFVPILLAGWLNDSLLLFPVKMPYD